MTPEQTRERGCRRRIAFWTCPALLVLLPLIAMQVTDQVDWDVMDFVIMGALLICVGVIYELASRKTSSVTYRLGVGIALTTAFVLVWINGAVGLIGNEGNDANVMYGGVIGVGMVGAALARFRAQGMARALFATAIAQALVAAIALIAGLGSAGPSWPLDILILNGLFTAMWLLSAWLFQKTARGQCPVGSPGGRDE